ncbi:MAG: imelysin family protein [Pseudomonadota bacterium]
MRLILAAAFALCATPLWAQSLDIKAIVTDHILPGYTRLASASLDMATAAASDCDPESASLVAAYHEAFDAWVRVSHLRFGPSEQNDRAFALAFWPDPRGSTPKTLATLMRDEDPVVNDPAEFATVSVAARGFYAMEFLLFDAQFTGADNTTYRCALVRTVANDIASNAAAILSDWENGYGELMSQPGNDTYRTDAEAAQQVFTAVSTGLEFTSDVRVARPMGTFERPRPNRAEARRSGRSLRHVILSLEATRHLTELLTDADPAVMEAFEAALSRANSLDDPVFAGVVEPQGRFAVEALKTDIDALRKLLAEEVGPSLGVAAGFNSLDGD